MSSDRPNILYLHTHDTGCYIQPYGYAARTPNLQRIAEEGILFRNAFCASPMSSPSRAALLTGEYPHVCGMRGMAHRGHRLYDYSTHIVHSLKRVGYVSALAGAQHIAPPHQVESVCETIGYDRYLGYPDLTQLANQDHAHEQAVSYIQSAPERPFFLSVGFGETHREFPELDDQDQPDFVHPVGGLPDNAETRAETARFYKMLESVDAKIGSILVALDETGLARNTVVISTTDHGIPFPRNKGTLYDGGLGVYLMIGGPGLWRGPATVDSLVGHINLYATMCDIAGVPTYHRVDAPSLLPLLEEGVAEVQDCLFAESNYQGANYMPARSVRTARWNYIRRYETDCNWYSAMGAPLEAPFTDQPGPGTYPTAPEELYDCVLDPSERNNLIESPETQPVLQDLRNRLDRWMVRTKDPLLRGFCPPVPGQKVNGLPLKFVDGDDGEGVR